MGFCDRNRENLQFQWDLGDFLNLNFLKSRNGYNKLKKPCKSSNGLSLYISRLVSLDLQKN